MLHPVQTVRAAVPLAVMCMVAIAPSIAKAENISHVQQLMQTRVCQGCDLVDSGFVRSNLDGVDLSGADLSRANLNQASLRNANLRGANLSGAVLANADLTGADLTNANLMGADLRDAFMTDAVLTGAALDGAVLNDAIGLSTEIVTPAVLYEWGLAKTQEGNYRDAIAYYNQALDEEPDFANAMLARAIAHYRLADIPNALADAAAAEALYVEQNNVEGQTVAQRLTAIALAYQQAGEVEVSEGKPNFLNFLSSLTGLVMRYLLR